MAYIPPHRRHLKDDSRPAPIPELLSPRFTRNFNLRSLPNTDRSGKIVYSDQAISRWIAVGLIDYDDEFPSCVHLEPVSVESAQRRGLQLVKSGFYDGYYELESATSNTVCPAIAEKICPDLLSSFNELKNEMKNQNLIGMKPALVARFGKIRFHESPSMRLESVGRIRVDETVLRQLKRSLYTNVTSGYMENVMVNVVPKIRLDFEGEKDIYHVKLSDNTQPNLTLSCKCSVEEDNKLVIYKVELNPVRHMVTDLSCLDKNLDLRIMLCAKRTLTSLTDDEMNTIKDLVESAVLDPGAKGGLRWPLGKSFSGNRFNVVGVWHTLAKAYKTPGLRLKVRDADRYDLRTGIGEVTQEVYLKLKGVVYLLENLNRNPSESVSGKLEEDLRLIWDNFLCCDLGF